MYVCGGKFSGVTREKNKDGVYILYLSLNVYHVIILLEIRSIFVGFSGACETKKSKVTYLLGHFLLLKFISLNNFKVCQCLRVFRRLQRKRQNLEMYFYICHSIYIRGRTEMSARNRPVEAKNVRRSIY